MEGSTKAKIAAVVACVVVGAPIWFFSDSSMAARVDECWEKCGGRPSNPQRGAGIRDPLMADRLYKLILAYKYTFRSDTDEYRNLLHDWLIRFGGDDTTWENHLVFWEYPYWNEDAKVRPDYYPKDPHPHTAKILLLWAEYWEKKKLYAQSKPLYELLQTHFKGDVEMQKAAEKALARDKVRTF